MEIVIGTYNAGKLLEYRQLLADFPFTLMNLTELGLTVPVDETGTTFEANAILKAQTYGLAAQRWALADDSGLVVDALNGEPGLYSARYGGGGLDDAGRRAYLLQKMAHLPAEQRTAHFVCAIALHHPQADVTYTVEGRCYGRILTEERSAGHGFGYDALFMPDGHELTFAQMPPEHKDSLSHRALAVAQLRPILNHLLSA